MTLLADTGFVVALLDGRDQHHGWAVEIAAAQPSHWPFVTCGAVMVEAAHLITSRTSRPTSYAFELVERGFLRLDFDLSDHVEAVAGLLHTYRDRPIDLADACLVCMSESFPDCTVVTTDSDFAVYRRRRDQPIPTLTP